jgi:hypothetical protein
MAEWLNRKLFKGWFWRKIGSNLQEWLKDAPVVVRAVLGITVLLCGWLYLVGYFPKPKPVVRGTGVFLQLFGFIFAAYGLERTLEKFEQTPSTSRILPWICEFPSVFDTTIRGSAEIEDEAEAIDAFGGTLKKELKLPKTLSERVRELEQSIADLRNEVEANRRHVDKEIEFLEGKIGEEIETVQERVQGVQEKVKEVNAGEGARWLEWSGVSFFVYGVPLASFPSSFLPAYRVLIVLLVAGTLLGSLHWYAD